MEKIVFIKQKSLENCIWVVFATKVMMFNVFCIVFLVRNRRVLRLSLDLVLLLYLYDVFRSEQTVLVCCIMSASSHSNARRWSGCVQGPSQMWWPLTWAEEPVRQKSMLQSEDHRSSALLRAAQQRPDRAGATVTISGETRTHYPTRARLRRTHLVLCVRALMYPSGSLIRLLSL